MQPLLLRGACVMNKIPGDLYSSFKARPNVPGGCPFCGPHGEFTRQTVCPHLLAEYGPKGLVWHAANDTVSALREQAAMWGVRRTRFPSPSWQELVGDLGIFQEIPEGRANYDNFASGGDSFIIGICRYVR